MLYKLVINFLCEAKLVDEVPIKSLLELINHDGTFLYHLMKRLGVDMSPIHNRLYHRPCTRAKILANHEIMLSFIATSGISPTLLPAPKVLYSATKEGIAANLIYQILRCIYRKRIRQGEQYMIKLANYLNALYDLRSEPVYPLSKFVNHTNLPASLIKLSLSTSCISFSLFVAGAYRFLEGSGVFCTDFLASFYKFPTTLLHMTRNHNKIRQLFTTMGIPLFFSPLTWLSIKDEEPYFDLRLIQIYLIFDKLRGCIPVQVSKQLKQVLFAPRSLDPALPPPLDLLWRDSISESVDALQHKLLEFAKMDGSPLDSEEFSEDLGLLESKLRKSKEPTLPEIYDKNTTEDVVHNIICVTKESSIRPENLLNQAQLQIEKEGLLNLFVEIPEEARNIPKQKGDFSTHHREARNHKMHNDDPLCATHPLYSDEEHQRLVDARTYRADQLPYANINPEVGAFSDKAMQAPTCIPIQSAATAASVTAKSFPICPSSIEELQEETAAAAQKQLEQRMNTVLCDMANIASDASEGYDIDATVQPLNEDSQYAYEHKGSSPPQIVPHIQVHHIQTDTIRHKSSLPHPCSMSPSAHLLSDECVQRSFRSHRDTITDSDDEVYNTATLEEIKEKYHICFIPSSGNATASSLKQPDQLVDHSDIRSDLLNEGNMSTLPKSEACCSSQEPLAPESDIPPITTSLPDDRKFCDSLSLQPQVQCSDESRTKLLQLNTNVYEVYIPEATLADANNQLDATQNDVETTITSNEYLHVSEPAETLPIENCSKPVPECAFVEGRNTSEDFRLARADYSLDISSGQINNVAEQSQISSHACDVTKTTLDALNTSVTTELGHSIVRTTDSHPDAVLFNDTSIYDRLDKATFKANNDLISQLPLDVQQYIHKHRLLSLSVLPTTALKNLAILPSNLHNVFIDSLGYIYRLCGSDFIRISTDGHVFVDMDEDSESDFQALKSFQIKSHGTSSLRHCDTTANKIDLNLSFPASIQLCSSQPMNGTIESNYTSTAFNVEAATSIALNSSQPRVSTPTVSILYLTPPMSRSITHKSSLTNQSRQTEGSTIVVQPNYIDDTPLKQLEIQDEVIPELFVKPTPQIELVDTDNIAPLICMDNSNEAGDAFIDGESVETDVPPSSSTHAVIPDIYLPADLNEYVSNPTTEEYSSLRSSKSACKSIDPSSIESKRSLDYGFSSSSGISRPVSSNVDYENCQSPTATELAIVIVEAPGDPILAPVESPTTDRLATAHGIRQIGNCGEGVTPDPSTVQIPEEQSRPSSSSVIMNMVSEASLASAFEVNPQIQQNNIESSKFLDNFIESYLRGEAPTQITTATSDLHTDTLPMEKRIQPSFSLTQKLNQYVLSTSTRSQRRNFMSSGISEITSKQNDNKPNKKSSRAFSSSNRMLNERMNFRAAHLAMPIHTVQIEKKVDKIPPKRVLISDNCLPMELRHLTQNQIQLYNKVNDGQHMNDGSPHLSKKIRNAQLTFSVPMRSSVQRFLYTLKCLNINFSKVNNETLLFAVLRNNDSGFYLGIYVGKNILLRVEICDILRIERELCQVFLHFRKAFIATGKDLPFIHLDLFEERRALAFIKDLKNAVETIKPLIAERQKHTKTLQ